MQPAGSSRRGIVSHIVMAIPAAHRAYALIVRPAHHVRNVRPARIALQRRIELMAVEAARILQHSRDFIPGRKTSGLVVGWSGCRSRGARRRESDADHGKNESDRKMVIPQGGL